MSVRQIAFIVLRALELGIILMIALPAAVGYGTLAIEHLKGGCGPGSSGGCEMGAAALALYTILPGFLLGVVISVGRDLKKHEA